jgi:hypothetical protein
MSSHESAASVASVFDIEGRVPNTRIAPLMNPSSVLPPCVKTTTAPPTPASSVPSTPLTLHQRQSLVRNIPYATGAYLSLASFFFFAEFPRCLRKM